MRLALCATIATLLTLGNVTAAESQTVSLSSLLDEMVDRDVTGRFPCPAYTCRQASSYDQASVSAEDTEAWWANNDRSFFIRSEQIGGREEWVMMDAEGPGCIVRKKQLWWIDGKPGDKLTLTVPVKQDGTYKLVAELTKAVNYGIVQICLDGNPAGEPIDLFNNGVIREFYQQGTHQLKAGDCQLTVEIKGANEQAIKRHMFGLDYLKFEPIE